VPTPRPAADARNHAPAAGRALKVVQEHFGYAIVGITLDISSHVSPHMQSDAAAKIDAGLRKALAG
jgi:hypothetical protein